MRDGLTTVTIGRSRMARPESRSSGHVFQRGRLCTGQKHTAHEHRHELPEVWVHYPSSGQSHRGEGSKVTVLDLLDSHTYDHLTFLDSGHLQVCSSGSQDSMECGSEKAQDREKYLKENSRYGEKARQALTDWVLLVCAVSAIREVEPSAPISLN